MGYDVHITRADHWLDASATPISLGEWRDYVASDDEVQLTGQAVAYVDGDPAIDYASDGLASWIAYTKHDPNGNQAWFDWQEGRIVVKNPDEEILDKMRQIASRLSARVVGDDGEEY